MRWNPMAFIENFHYLVSGMVGIFVVIGIIVLITILLNKVTTIKKKNDAN